MHRIAYSTDLSCIVLHIPQTCLALYCIFHRLVLHRIAYSTDLSCIVLDIPQTCLASYCIFHRLVLHRIAYSTDLSCIVLHIPQTCAAYSTDCQQGWQQACLASFPAEAKAPIAQNPQNNVFLRCTGEETISIDHISFHCRLTKSPLLPDWTSEGHLQLSLRTRLFE